MRSDKLASFDTPEADRKLNRLLAGELDRDLRDYLDAPARQQAKMEQLHDLGLEVARMKREGLWDEFAATGGLL
jgi:predicted component of viral defense system (DUF524 family)